MGTAFGPIWF